MLLFLVGVYPPTPLPGESNLKLVPSCMSPPPSSSQKWCFCSRGPTKMHAKLWQKSFSNSQRSVRPWIAGLEPFQRVEELFLRPSRWLQEPPKAFQSSSKYLLDVTTVCFGSLLFPKLIFQLCITRNHHFCAFGEWF